MDPGYYRLLILNPTRSAILSAGRHPERGEGSCAFISNLTRRIIPGVVKQPLVCLVCAACLLAGCAKPMPLSVMVTDPPPARRLRCQFTRAYYQPRERGALTAALVGLGEKGGAPTRETMILEMVWLSQPGKTHSDPTGINVKITYVVDLAGSRLIFDGAGYLRVWENKDKTSLEGRIETSELHLRSHPGVAEPSMKTISITGTFTASRNAGQTVENVVRVKQYLHAGE
jgi:hypothetical protein